MLLKPDDDEVVRDDVPQRALRLALVGLTVGFLAGLLANAGGFLLVPLYLAALKLPIKTALSCSLAVAAVLAIPGTIVHAALGHIDWTVTLVFGARVGAALEPRCEDRAAHERRNARAALRRGPARARWRSVLRLTVSSSLVEPTVDRSEERVGLVEPREVTALFEHDPVGVRDAIGDPVRLRC